MKDSERFGNREPVNGVSEGVNTLRFALIMMVAMAFVAAFVPRAIHAQASSAHAVDSAATSAPSAVVEIKQYAYTPGSLTVAAGTTVVFKNSDTVAHTVTAADKSFDSGNLEAGATWSHAFPTPGSFAYLCAYHTYMKGTIVVK
jgi:plastocyanin